MRKVEMILSPGQPHFVGDGFKVNNFFPSNHVIGLQGMSPFILLDYNAPMTFEPSDHPRGVGAHPHKGFETVTIAYKGKVEHHDSSGGGGVIEQGDVQWMTAGKGVLHKEFHETEWSKKGGEFQMVQLWVNLPAKDKSTKPKYQAIKHVDFARLDLEDNTGFIELIAGDYDGKKGPASTFTPIHLMNLRLNKAKKTSLKLPKAYNTALLVLEGQIKVNQEEAPKNHLVIMGNDEDDFNIEAQEDALVLVMSGKPIDEPIAAQGPFVMNTRDELIQAFDDFNKGKFGYLE